MPTSYFTVKCPPIITTLMLGCFMFVILGPSAKKTKSFIYAYKPIYINNVFFFTRLRSCRLWQYSHWNWSSYAKVCVVYSIFIPSDLGAGSNDSLFFNNRYALNELHNADASLPLPNARHVRRDFKSSNSPSEKEQVSAPSTRFQRWEWWLGLILCCKNASRGPDAMNLNPHRNYFRCG